MAAETADRSVLHPPAATASARALTARRWLTLWRQAFALIRSAAPREARILFGLQVLSGVGAAGQLAVAGVTLRSLAGGEAVSVRGLAVPLTAGAFLIALTAVAAAATAELGALLAERVAQFAQEQVIDVALAAELEAFETPGFHDRLIRAQNQTDQHAWEIVYGSARLVTGLIGVAVVGVALTLVSPLVSLLALVAYVPLWLAIRRNNRSAYQFAFDRTPSERERSYLQRLLTGSAEAAELRLFGTGPYLRGRFRQLYGSRLDELERLVRRRILRSVGANLLMAALATASLVLLVRLVEIGRLSVPQAAVAVLALNQLRGRLGGLVDAAAALHRAGRFLDDHVSFAELAPIAEARQSRAREAPTDVAVYRIDRVSFRYPGTERTVLDDVSLQLNRGDVVALVGENGSGKTTLAKLVCGLYQPTQGTLWWDDVALATCKRATIARGVGAIFQEFVSYALSLADNVALGDIGRRADRAGMEAAARQAGAWPIVQQIGWETRLSREYEGGEELSGGQWQRVALARAFFRSAPLLVLDEPSAALDARAEADLFASLRELYRGRTVLLISHRFSTVRCADRIYVLAGGRIVEQGSHDQLVAIGGTYASLFAAQADAFR